MLFNSFLFIFIFLPVTLLLYYQLSSMGRHRLSLGWLVMASLVFYAWWNPANLWVIIFSVLFNYMVGYALMYGRYSQNAGRRKQLLIFGIATNVGLLAYYKYVILMAESVDTLLKTSFSTTSAIIIPLAISFFTFQQIAYLVDVYRREAHEKDFLYYSLFVTFFPQLISGPIVHHREMIPQFKRRNTGDRAEENIGIGIAIFTIGLFKKIIIADGIAAYSDPVFNIAAYGAPISFIEAWGGMLAFTFQIYFDFSGYIDMAIGLARMFGIRLPMNFDSPYQATNRFDFWQRWHMTFTRFMRRHVYMPLARIKKLPGGPVTALFLSTLIGGLWHGLGLTFILWGALQALTILVNHGWRRLRRRLGHDLGKSSAWGTVFSVLLTFAVSTYMGIFFRAKDLASAFNIFKGSIGMNGILLPSGFEPYIAKLGASFISMLNGIGVRFGETPLFQGESHLLWLAVLIAIVLFAPNTQQWFSRFDPVIDPFDFLDKKSRKKTMTKALPDWAQFRLNAGWAFIIAVIGVAAVIGMTGAQRFIYFQF